MKFFVKPLADWTWIDGIVFSSFVVVFVWVVYLVFQKRR